MTRPAILSTLSCILLLPFVSCAQKHVTTFETGTVMKIKTGIIEKISKLTVTRDATGKGAFAEMASSTAEAVTPGILAAGTSKIATSTGALMDSQIETVAKIRIRVRLENGELIEVLQNDVPGMSFKVGDTIIISSEGVAGNVWPD